LCECRPPLSIGGLFCWCEEHPSPVAGLAPGARFRQPPLLPPLYFSLFFSLFPIVSGNSAFRKQGQLVILYFGSIPHCKSIVFFEKIF
jgi:hypothetical protein